MTEAEKLRDDFSRSIGGIKPSRNHCDRADDIAETLGLSWAALAWCRANPELVEALANGTWQATPKELSSNMDTAVRVALDREPDYSRAGFSAWWWHNALKAAPKKPE